MTEQFERTEGGAVLMDGNRLRDEIVAELNAEITAAGGPEVCLATVLVGEDKPSRIYVRNKQRKAAEAAMVSRTSNWAPMPASPRWRGRSGTWSRIRPCTAFWCSSRCPRGWTPTPSWSCSRRRRMSTG